MQIEAKTDSEQVVSAIVQKLEASIETGTDLLRLLKTKELTNIPSMIIQLQTVVQECDQLQQPILNKLEHSHSEDLLGNLSATLSDLSQQVAANKVELDRTEFGSADSVNSALEHACFLCECQLIPLLRITKENFYFWGYVYQSTPRRKQYYATEFAANYQNHLIAQGLPLPYSVSVVVVGYNKLEMTQRCVSSILENTDFARLNCELILVDNGSTDGTLEYFKTIPDARIIHFKHNMQIVSFTMLPMICRSKYYVHIANDTVLTKDWLDILLRCITSDPKIALACPATCNISNNQDLNVPTDDCDKLVELAKLHNKSNPLLWRERAQVYPPLGIFSLDIMNQIGFWDPYFYSFYCCDDDYSLRARRGGFKQILCEDVFCFHKSMGTLKDQTKDLCVLGGELFKLKNGFKPWRNDSIYDFNCLKYLTEHIPDRQQINILSINSGIGDTPRQLKNLLTEAGKQVSIYHILTNSTFVDDVKYQANGVVCVPSKDLIKAVRESFPNVDFSYISIADPIKKELLTPEMIKALSERMLDDGRMALIVYNSFNINDVLQAFNLNLPISNLQFTPKDLKEHLQKFFACADISHIFLHNIEKSQVLAELQRKNIRVDDFTYNLLITQQYRCLLKK